MSMVSTQAQLEGLLAETDNKVLALSGRWGTGKTHMWAEIRKLTHDDAVRKSLTVSLFGAASVADLKLRLVQKAVPYLGEEGPRKDALAAGWRLAQKAAAFVHPTLPLAAQLAEFAVPGLLRDKFIVIDDIERKREALSTDEILGFIDDFVQNYGCRFLLILNSDKLADASSWERYREKVIDEELRLQTTPAEAFEIAAPACPPQFRESLKAAVETCQISNIRIIRKIVRAVRRILGDRDDLQPDVVARLVPSAVLLCAIHFKGIEEGPNLQFVLDYDAGIRIRERARREAAGSEAAPEDKGRARWILLLEQLGIRSIDQYERIVADYLASGMLDATAVSDVVDRYARESRLADAQFRVRSLYQSTIWDPEMTDAQVVARGRDLLADIPLLDCFSVTAMSNYLSEFEGGAEVADAMIDAFVALVEREAAKPDASAKSFVFESFIKQPLHPRIELAFEHARLATAKPEGLLAVCLRLASANGWGREEEETMNASTVESYERIILSTRGPDLATFLLKNASWVANKDTYQKHFGSAMDHFVEACRRICASKPGTRWPQLLRDVFKESRVERLLDHPAADAAKDASHAGTAKAD